MSSENMADSWSHWWYSWLSVLLVCCVTDATIDASMFSDVRVYPNGPLFLLEGSPLSINCTIQNSNASVEDLEIVLSEYSTGQKRNLSIFTTRYPGEGTVAVNIPKTTLNDNGTYICYYEGKFKNMKVVTIGEKPQPPKSLHCVSPNFQQLECYAEMSQSETDIPMSWTMEYRKGSLNRTVSCAKFNASYFICANINGSNIFRIFSNYTITLTGRSEDFNVTLQNITYVYTDFDIVKPNPVRDLNLSLTENSSVVVLSWRFPAKLEPHVFFHLSYRVKVLAENQWDTHTLQFDKLPQEDIDHVFTYTVQNLIPYTSYTVSLSSKPINSEGDWYWSEPSIIRFTTDTDIPGASVSLTQGSFYALDCGQHFICPVIYWKNPERRVSHGKINSYQVCVSETDSWSKQAHCRIETGRRTSEAIKFWMLKNESYVVEVKAGTEKGFSNAVSTLAFPPWNTVEILQPHRVVIEIDEDSHTVVVSTEIKQGIFCEQGLQQTVYWCTVDNLQGNQSYAECQDDLDWQTTNMTQNCKNLSQTVILPDTRDIDKLVFGVSLSLNGSSGGIQWKSCRFDAMNQAPDVPLYRVDPVKNKDTELKITVLYDECYPGNGGRPTTYQVGYKKFESDSAICPEGTNVSSYPVDLDQPVIYLSDLEARAQYVVCLRALNRNLAGNYGKPVVVKTGTADEEDGAWKTWLAVGISLPLVLILLGITAVLCIIHIRKRTRAIQIDDVPIKNTDTEQGGYRQTSFMTGYQNGIGTESGIDLQNSQTTSFESGPPVLAQSFSPPMSCRNSRTPPPERHRKISPALSGYEAFIIGSEDIVYGECERRSLLGGANTGNGIDNDLDVARIIPAESEKHEDIPKTRCQHAVEEDDTEIADKAEYNRELNKGKENAEKTDDRNITEGKDNTIRSKISMQNLMNPEYVEEDHMHELSAKHNLTQNKNFDANDSINSKSLERKDELMNGKPNAVDKNTLQSNHSEYVDTDKGSDIKIAKHQNGLRLDILVTETTLQDQKNKEELTKTGLNQTESFRSCVEKENQFAEGSGENNTDDDDIFSDIDLMDDDMFSNLSVAGDGELTDILEPYANNEIKSEFGTPVRNPGISGYIGTDQISICSFESNASSLQDRQSPEKKGCSQDQEHSTVATSPVLSPVIENTYQPSAEIHLDERTSQWTAEAGKKDEGDALHERVDIDKLDGIKESLNSVKGQGAFRADQITLNGIIKQAEMMGEQNDLNEINEKTSSGHSSGTGISSYVTAGNVVQGKKDLSEICNGTDFISKEILTDDNELENMPVRATEATDRVLSDITADLTEEIGGDQLTRL